MVGMCVWFVNAVSVLGWLRAGHEREGIRNIVGGHVEGDCRLYVIG